VEADQLAVLPVVVVGIQPVTLHLVLEPIIRL